MKKRKDGRYERKIRLPSGDTMYAYGKTQREVNEQIDGIKLRYAMGAVAQKAKVTVRDWAQVWWDAEKKGKTGASSQEGYLRALNNYILPSIGELKVVDIRPLHCQQLLNSMADKSKSLQRQVRVVLNGVFRYAVINGLILGSPAQYIKYTVPADERREALQPEQVIELLDAARDSKAELLIHLALYCGLRRGEVMGLMWSDVGDGVLHISRAVQVVRNQPVIKGTKSKAGVRTIPVPEHLRRMLEQTPRTSVYVIPAADGGPMSKTAFDRRWGPVQRALSYPMVYHQLRHTYATNLHKLGIDPKTMQYLMGHAQLDMTLGTYTDIQDEQLATAKNKLAELLYISQKFVKVSSAQ